MNPKPLLYLMVALLALVFYGQAEARLAGIGSAAVDTPLQEDADAATFRIIAEFNNLGSTQTAQLVLDEGGVTYDATVGDDFTLGFTNDTPIVCTLFSGTCDTGCPATVTPSPTGTGGNAWDMLFTATKADTTAIYHCDIPITPVADQVDEPNEKLKLTLSFGSGLGGQVTDQEFTLVDNDTAGFTVSKSTVTTSEDETTDSFTVVLTSDPTGNVTIPVSSSNTDEATVDTANLVFNPSGGGDPWNVPQTVTVTGVDDAPANPQDGPVAYTIDFGDPTSPDSIYDAKVASDVGGGSVAGTNQDNDSGFGVLEFRTTGVTRTEGQAAVTVFVDRTGGASGTATVKYMSGGGDATPGDDYTAIPETTLTFIEDDVEEEFTVTVVDDMDLEPGANETFEITLFDVTGATLNDAKKVLTVSIIDNETGGTISIADFSGTEDSGTATLTITRTGSNLGGPVSVSLDVDDDNPLTPPTSAEKASDYTAIIGQTVTFNDQETSKMVAVTLSADNDEEADETFTATISDGGSLSPATLGQATATGTITNDDDAGVIALTCPSSTVAEGDTVTIPVGRTVDSDGAVQATVGLMFTPPTTSADIGPSGDGTFLVDGSPATVVAFAHGDSTSQDIDVLIFDDAIPEGVESFSVTLTDPTNGADLGTATCPFSIAANDSPDVGVLSIDPAVYNQVEGDLVEIIVTRTGVDCIVTNPGDCDVSIDWETMFGTAVDEDNDDDGGDAGCQNCDFNKASGTLTFTGTNTTPDEGNIMVQIVQDTNAEPLETFTVTIDPASATGGVETGNTTATVNIAAEDNPDVITVDPATYMEVEGNAGTTAVEVIVTRTGDLVGEVIVGYNTVITGSADASDFVAISGGSLTFADSSATPTGGNIMVLINGDTDDEPDDDFTLRLDATTTGAGSATVDNTDGVITILNDDSSGGLIQFDPDSYNVNESAGVATLTVTRTGTGVTGTASVNYTTVSGSAVDEANDDDGGSAACENCDFNAVNGTLNWGSGDVTPQEIMVPLNDDLIPETLESFTVTLSGVAGPNNPTLGTSTATVSIPLNDQVTQTSGVFAIDPSSVAVSEGNGTAVVLVTRVDGTDGETVLSWSTTSGTAVDEANDDAPGSPACENCDFNASSGTLTFPDGQTIPTEGNITVPIVDDLLIEPSPNEVFSVTIEVMSGDGTVNPAAATGEVEIIDNDAPSPGVFSVLDAQVNEGNGTVTVTVVRQDGAQGEVTVDYATTDVTAVAPGDYTAVVTDTLTFIDGDSAEDIVLTIIDDGDAEDDETFTVTLSNPGTNEPEGPLPKIADPEATVTILDNDGGGLFSIDDVFVVEDEGIAILTVTRSEDNDTGAVLTFQSFDGTAEDENGSFDYGAVIGELEWLAGDTDDTKTIAVFIRADGVDEDAETFIVRLTSLVSRGGTIVKQNGTVTITDPIPIPTLDRWVLLLLALGLGMLGVHRIRKVNAVS